MTCFEEFIEKMEKRRDEEKKAKWNEELSKRLQQRSYEESLSALYASMTIFVGTSDVLAYNVFAGQSAPSASEYALG